MRFNPEIPKYSNARSLMMDLIHGAILHSFHYPSGTKPGKPGEVILSLPEHLRDILKNLTSDDMKNIRI